jgi:hypothetical protein
MGLQERRMIADLQNTTLPERSREIEEICGKSVPYEVDWSSFESDAQALNFLDNIACHRINMALRTIALDQMGRDALRDSLKTIKLKNVADATQRKLDFADGVLELHAPWAMGTQGMHGDGAIRDTLMARL